MIKAIRKQTAKKAPFGLGAIMIFLNQLKFAD